MFCFNSKGEQKHIQASPMKVGGRLWLGAPMHSSAAVINHPATPEADFYRQVLTILNDAGTPFLVGGAFALGIYTGIVRNTKDLDLFVRQRDCEQALKALSDAGYPTEHTFDHWLAKVYHKGEYIDLIFNSGNAQCP